MPLYLLKQWDHPVAAHSSAQTISIIICYLRLAEASIDLVHLPCRPACPMLCGASWFILCAFDQCKQALSCWPHSVKLQLLEALACEPFCQIFLSFTASRSLRQNSEVHFPSFKDCQRISTAQDLPAALGHQNLLCCAPSVGACGHPQKLDPSWRPSGRGPARWSCSQPQVPGP